MNRDKKIILIIIGIIIGLTILPQALFCCKMVYNGSKNGFMEYDHPISVNSSLEFTLYFFHLEPNHTYILSHDFSPDWNGTFIATKETHQLGFVFRQKDIPRFLLLEYFDIHLFKDEYSYQGFIDEIHIPIIYDKNYLG